MTESTRRTTLTACLALGMADLVVLNVSVVPRLRRRTVETADLPRPAAHPMVAVAIEGAPPLVQPEPLPTGELQPRIEPAMVFFATNVARLGTAQRVQVDQLAGERAGEPTFVVDGHADVRGHEAYNERLSRLRATAVAARLMRHGIPSNRIEVHAYGASRPRASGEDPSALQRNRRVEIFLRGEAR